MSKPLDLTGQTFGQLRVLARAATDMHGKAQWACVCACGATTIARASNLKSEYTKSCGTCAGAHPTGVKVIKYRIQSMEGRDIGYDIWEAAWCIVRAEDTGELICKHPPTGRSKGDAPSPGIARGMGWLARNGFISERNNRTFRRWAIEEGVNTDAHARSGDAQHCVELYYKALGEEAPITAPKALHAAQAPREIIDIDPRTPEEIEHASASLAALFDTWAPAD
jgi:hypothetical protein